MGLEQKYPHADLNCTLQLRRLTLYPLSYGGGELNFIISNVGHAFSMTGCVYEICYVKNVPTLSVKKKADETSHQPTSKYETWSGMPSRLT